MLIEIILCSTKYLTMEVITGVDVKLELAHAAGITWPLPDGMNDTALVQALFPGSTSGWSQQFTQPDFPAIHQELKRKGVTLQLLWEEYAAINPDTAYQYSWFCELYKEWRAHLRVSMRQTHRAGEKLFVDYAGQTVPIVDPQTGEAHDAQIFVAVLRRLQLHLRRGHLDAATPGLDRLTRPCLLLLRRGAGTADP